LKPLEISGDSMKAKLIKSDIQYRLHNEEGIVIATSLENGKLSIKNCQAIANGYDLDELAEKHYGVHIKHGHTEEDSLQRKIDFILGFVSALKILGDKKFSEDDLRLAMHFGKFGETNNQTTTIGFIKSLQQTEWDVEIVIGTTNIRYDGGSYITANPKPKLDENGCLILKRI
jgi:hypothetical protein